MYVSKIFLKCPTHEGPTFWFHVMKEMVELRGPRFLLSIYIENFDSPERQRLKSFICHLCNLFKLNLSI